MPDPCRMGWSLRSAAAVMAVFWLFPAGAADRGFSGNPAVDALEPVIRLETPPAAMPGRLRMASFNIQDFTDGVNDDERNENHTPAEARLRAHGVAGALGPANPDILCLQEIENRAALEILNQSFARPYPLGYITCFRDLYRHKVKQNLAVLARVPLERVRMVDFATLHGGSRPPRGLLNFTVNLDARTRLGVYVVHLKSNYGEEAQDRAERRQALELLRADARRLAARDDKARWELLVAGDTNTDPAAHEFARDRSLEPLADWVDVWRRQPAQDEFTIPRTHDVATGKALPAALFDRLFVTPGLATNTRWRVQGLHALHSTRRSAVNGTPQHVSDHSPICWEIRADSPDAR